VAIRSAGKNAEYDAQAAKLIFIADEFDCIEIRRDKSTAFLVNQFGAQKVGAGVLGADHVKVSSQPVNGSSQPVNLPGQPVRRAKGRRQRAWR
jgi:hypothetical protein